MNQKCGNNAVFCLFFKLMRPLGNHISIPHTSQNPTAKNCGNMEANEKHMPKEKTNRQFIIEYRKRNGHEW